jgi:vacuolar-type H+-ATPase subunit D/Vma8
MSSIEGPFRIVREELIKKIRATYDNAKREQQEYNDAVEYVKSQATAALKSKMHDLEPNINIWGSDTIEIEYRTSLTALGFTMPEMPKNRYSDSEYEAMLQAIRTIELSDSQYISHSAASKFLKFV